MNCDQAFDVMTSSRRASDRGLHAHLDECPRCRGMRHTLGPALEMFAEDAATSLSLAPWESDLDRSQIASQAAHQLSTGDPAPRRGLAGLWSYAAAIVVGAGLVWCTIVRNPSTASVPAARRGETLCYYLADTRPLGVTSQKMTQSCVSCHAGTNQP